MWQTYSYLHNAKYYVENKEICWKTNFVYICANPSTINFFFALEFEVYLWYSREKVFISMWVNWWKDLNFFVTCDRASNNLEGAFMLGKMSKRTTYFKRLKFRWFSSPFNFFKCATTLSFQITICLLYTPW